VKLQRKQNILASNPLKKNSIPTRGREIYDEGTFLTVIVRLKAEILFIAYHRKLTPL